MFAVISVAPELVLHISYNFDTVPEYVFWPNNRVSISPEVGEVSYGGYIFVNKLVVDEPPTSLHVANGSTLSYDENVFTITETITYAEPVVDDMRSIAKDKVVTWRNNKQDSGFEFANVIFQSDLNTRASISGAVQMAILANMSNTPYNVSWTAIDNTSHSMDANTVIQFGVTAATTYQYWYDQALDLKNQIDAANTANSIQLILDSMNA